MTTTSKFEWRKDEDKEIHDISEGLLLTTSASTPSLTALRLDPPKTPTSLQAGSSFRPGIGDDTSPPNAISNASLMNGIVVPVTSSAGWSHHPPRDRAYPSRRCYNIKILEDGSLELRVILEYSNPYFGESTKGGNESMMVRAAIAKTCLHGIDEELRLISTKYQEKVGENDWIDITADVDYTETADQVVEAVLADSQSGQTAGKTTVTAEQVDVTLGPFSQAARLVLTFQAEQIYTYQAMSVDNSTQLMGSHKICPLMVSLPFASMESEAGLGSISVSLSAPAGTEILSQDTFRDAYVHLKNQQLMKPMTLIALKDLMILSDKNDSTYVGYQFNLESLPCRPCGILSWLVIPNDNDFVDVANELSSLKIATQQQQLEPQNRIQAIIQQPDLGDDASLQVPLPGHGPLGHLLRVKMTLPKSKSRTIPCFILNLTLTDKSGSTGMSVSHSSLPPTTMRNRFNELAVMRFLKRLESIPALVQAGVLLQEDVWMDACLAFDGSAPAGSILKFSFCVKDVLNTIVDTVAEVRRRISRNPTGLNLESGFKAFDANSIESHVKSLLSIAPGGMTDFSVAPKTIAGVYSKWEESARALFPKDTKIACCTFVEFDTDGGHNGLEYTRSLQTMCEMCNVRSGVVTGFGSWVNQDCATRVAKILEGGVPAQLALNVPDFGSEGMDNLFRRSFGAWISALRQAPPVSLNISAGSLSFPIPSTPGISRMRDTNAIEVLAIRRIVGGHKSKKLPIFDSPDISNEKFTATVLKSVEAGDELLVYIVSRFQSLDHLAQSLKITTNESSLMDSSPPSLTSIEVETIAGDLIGHDWLTMLTSSHKNNTAFRMAPLLCKTSLRSRLEEEVSFRFNIPSPSGMTSFLGRCKTVSERAAIDELHRPKQPIPPVKYRFPFGSNSTPSSRRLFGSRPIPTPRGGLFGAAAPSASAPTVIASHSATSNSGGLFETACSSASGGILFGAAPATAPAGGLFGAPAGGFKGFKSFPAPAGGGLFGAPAPVPAGGGLFGAPAPAPAFGSPTAGVGAVSPTSSPFGSFSVNMKSNEDDPLWSYAMLIPSEANEAILLYLRPSLSTIKSKCMVLAKDPSLTFYCNVCRNNILPDEPRFHCLDCDDFDTCFRCKDVGCSKSLHRVIQIKNNTGCIPIKNESDSLISSLLQTSPVNIAFNASTTNFSEYQSTVVNKLKLQRFLLNVLNWWPLLRSMCKSYHLLPLCLSEEIKNRLTHVVKNGTDSDLVEMTKIIIESIEREENKVA